MGLTDYLSQLLGLADDDTDGLAALQDYLRAQEATLQLTAEYGRPTFDTTGEPTAVFPYTTYHDGAVYASGVKEFAIPDDGLGAQGAPLTKFLESHGIESVEELGEIQGQADSARINSGGDIEVSY